MTSYNGKIVVTGLGIVSPLGCGQQTFWEALTEGAYGIGPVTCTDTSEFINGKAGEVKGFDPRAYIARKSIRSLDRITRFAIAASRLALEDARLEMTPEDRQKTGIILGSMYSGWDSIASFRRVMDTDKLKRTNPTLFANTVLNAPVSQVAIELGIHGLCTSLNTGFASGSDALAWGYDYLRNRRAEVVIAGGAEELNRWVLGCFDKNRSASHTGPEEVYRPFDLNRKGIMIGEGACMLVLETAEHARKRRAPVYGEFSGYGTSTGCHSPLFTSKQRAEDTTLAVRSALDHTGVTPDEVAYICAEGNGTRTGDILETRTIQQIFQHRSPSIPVSSVKSMIGHTLGAAGAFNAACCCLAVKNALIPPTIHYTTPDPQCDLDCVPNTSRKRQVPRALSHAFSNGGNNSVLVFRGFEGGHD